jgi:hypothetical protein
MAAAHVRCNKHLLARDKSLDSFTYLRDGPNHFVTRDPYSPCGILAVIPMEDPQIRATNACALYSDKNLTWPNDRCGYFFYA